MHALLQQTFETKKFTNSKNEVIPIHSETSKEQCIFLQTLIRENKFKSSVEIGIAYGMSTLAIVESITENGGKSVALDPFQYEDWGGNGLDLVKQAGYSDSLEFVNELSFLALPRFHDQGRKFDFAYIDTVKIFDYLMVDFFFLDRLLEVNGVIVFDDVTFPGIRKLLRYLSQLPHYEICGQVPQNSKLVSIRKRAFKSIVPDFALKEELRVTDYALGVNTHCVALRKTAEDNRRWDWHTPF